MLIGSTIDASQITSGTLSFSRLPTASASSGGALSAADWVTFNSKLSSVTVGAGLTGNGTSGSPLAIANSGVTNAMLASGIDAAKLTGTIADSNLSSNVALLNKSQTFAAATAFSGGVTIGGQLNAGGGVQIGNSSASATSANAGLLRWNGSSLQLVNGSAWVDVIRSDSSLGGDLSGTPAAATVKGLQGRALGSTAPIAGQTLSYNGTQWLPSTPLVIVPAGNSFPDSPVVGQLYYDLSTSLVMVWNNQKWVKVPG